MMEGIINHIKGVVLMQGEQGIGFDKLYKDSERDGLKYDQER